MPDYRTNTRIVFTDPDLPEPGEVREHHIGPYTILIEHPERTTDPGPARLPEDRPTALEALEQAAQVAEETTEEKPAERFAPAIMDLKKTLYTHAVELRKHGNSKRARVADFAVCNGRNNGRPVRGRDATRTMDDVDCPRCLHRMAQMAAKETK